VAAEKTKLSEYFRKYTDYTSSESVERGLKLRGLLFNLNTNKSGISKLDNLDLLAGEDVINFYQSNYRKVPLIELGFEKEKLDLNRV
jgi:hypothetical protein